LATPHPAGIGAKHMAKEEGAQAGFENSPSSGGEFFLKCVTEGI